jgi:hypothetical protein
LHNQNIRFSLRNNNTTIEHNKNKRGIAININDKGKIMGTIQERPKQPNTRKKTDQLCGRLILWDVGTPREDLVMLGTDYCHAKYDFSTQDHPKPCLPLLSDPGTLSPSTSTVTAIKKALEHFRLTRAQRANQLCGRLIVWDVGTPQENIVILATDYCPIKYHLPKREEE